MQSNLKSKTVKISFLDDQYKAKMYSIFEKYYDSVSKDYFLSDLYEKTHIFLLFKGHKKLENLIGFSTIQYQLRHDLNCCYLFSGDTVIEKEYWGSKVLQKAFFWYILMSKIKNFHQPLYWMLISKGYKTYMMMRRNFKLCYPNYQNTMPPKMNLAWEKYYTQKYDSCFKKDLQLIIFESNKGSVKEKMADPSEKDLRDPDIQFFLKSNPKYQEGQELACITEIVFSDFYGHIFKYFSPLFNSKK